MGPASQLAPLSARSASINPGTLRFRRCQSVFGKLQGQDAGFEKVEDAQDGLDRIEGLGQKVFRAEESARRRVGKVASAVSTRIGR